MLWGSGAAARPPGGDIPGGLLLAVKQGAPPVAQFVFRGRGIAAAEAMPGEPARQAGQIAFAAGGPVQGAEARRLKPLRLPASCRAIGCASGSASLGRSNRRYLTLAKQ